MDSDKKILITGTSGFIGQAVCEKLSGEYRIIGIDNRNRDKNDKIIIDNSDITDYEKIFKFISNHNPDIIIHCAGLAHQKLGHVDSGEYFLVNSHASENLAKAAIQANQNVHFIFLSSISVYGENHIKDPVSEEKQCRPSSDYANSKLDAEERLTALYNSGKLKKLDILRLAPVYDYQWSLNLDRRVFAPKKASYLKFGSGEQEMSAVSRENVVEFIEYRLKQENKSSANYYFNNIFNVCDEKPYQFKEIIRVFQDSSYHPDRFVMIVPLFIVWIMTRAAGLILKSKRQWLHSCYDKLAYNLVFSNKKMLATGFKPRHNLKTVFLKNR